MVTKPAWFTCVRHAGRFHEVVGATPGNVMGKLKRIGYFGPLLELHSIEDGWPVGWINGNTWRPGTYVAPTQGEVEF